MYLYNETDQTKFKQFLYEITTVIRTYISDSQLVIIADNCGIHKSDVVRAEAKRLKINLFYTVPYSPQLNFPVENFFAILKASLPTIELKVNYSQRTIIQTIVSKCMEVDRTHFGSRVSANQFGAWKQILEECLRGKILTSERKKSAENCIISLRNKSTWRK